MSSHSYRSAEIANHLELPSARGNLPVPPNPLHRSAVADRPLHGRIDVAFALLALRTDGVAPPPLDFPDEAAFAAYLAGHDAWSAVSPAEGGLVDFETLRAGWLQDLRAALPWAAGLLGLPDP